LLNNMPKPRKNEKKDEFISRCIEYVVDKEDMKQTQAVAYCYAIWDEDKKSGDNK